MLEILFTESAAGGLKYASHYGKGNFKPHTTAFIINNDGSQMSAEQLDEYRKEVNDKEKAKWEKAVPMDIESRDVVALSFGLHHGDISEDYPGEKRMKYLQYMMSVRPDFVQSGHMKKWFDKMQQSLEKVLELVKAGQPVRLWYSDTPDELCGLYHLIYLIDKIRPDCEIYTVKLPEFYTREDGTIVQYNGWGGVSPDEWHLHYKPEKVTNQFKTLCVSNWQRLKKDNAPVRVMLNGTMESMPEDIYDSFIVKEINAMDNQFRQAVVIGNVLGKYKLSVGDAFVFHRMEKMIEDGKLSVIEPALSGRPVYHRILKKNM